MNKIFLGKGTLSVQRRDGTQEILNCRCATISIADPGAFKSFRLLIGEITDPLNYREVIIEARS